MAPSNPDQIAAPPPDARRPCVLIPSYNNVGAIAAVIAEVQAHDLPILVVNDGSTDGTGDAARDAGVEVVEHEVNQGKGQALLTGWAAAASRGYSHAICMDADGQHLAEDLPRFVAAIQAQPDALHVGTRPETGPNVPQSSKTGRKISDFMLWAAAGTELDGEQPDSQCGFRAYPLQHTLALPLKARRYSMEMEVLVRAAWLGVPVKELAISVYYPPPEERVSHFDKWRDNRRIVGMYTRLMLIRLIWPITRPRTKLLPG